MSIPKVLHYCWFGGAPKPKNIQNCIRSWKKYCPDYEIIEWNEQNFDVSQSLYTRQAYDARRWAFVADYARLKILYEQGPASTWTPTSSCSARWTTCWRIRPSLASSTTTRSPPALASGPRPTARW